MNKYIKPAVLFSWLFLISVNLISQHSAQNKFLFVGHRGASYLAPENTLASINLVWKIGADAAECDVMLTSDNRVVVIYDDNT